MTEEEEKAIGKAMKEMAKQEKDKQRKMLHGTSKSITAENKFRLLNNNGKRNREEAKGKTSTSGRSISPKASSRIRIP
tara:strand:- start:580 stop:813 length:234 start_codon:yes stop_codon:yes gene_type:complete